VRSEKRDGSVSHFNVKREKFLGIACFNSGTTYMMCRKILAGDKHQTPSMAGDAGFDLKGLALRW